MENDLNIKFLQSVNNLSVKLPVSKSEYNRASIISYLSGRKVVLKNYSDAADSVRMDDLISQISDGKSFYLNCGDAGTVVRFLLSLVSITYGEWTLTGSERMKQRPVGILVDALRKLGAEIEYLGSDGFLPVKVKGRNLEGGKICLDPGISSQFISSLMMIGPVLKNGIEIDFTSEPVSFPYIKMTASLMQQCGADLQIFENRVEVKPKYYSSCEISCENDWSSAAFFYALAAVNGGLKIKMNGLRKNSIQGDAVVKDIFIFFGVETVFTNEGIEICKNNQFVSEPFSYDFTDCPDLAQSLAFTCAALRLSGKFYGLSTLKNKETDRIVALKNELEKCGMKCDVTENSLAFIPVSAVPDSIYFNTYDDHRMVMSCFVMASVCNEITIENYTTVNKSFPGFWENVSGLINNKI